MLKKKGVWSLLVLLVFLLGLVSFAVSKQGGYGKQSCPWIGKIKMAMKNSDELGLSKKQVDDIKDIYLEAKKKRIELTAEIDLIGVDIKSALCEDMIDQEKVNELIDQKFEIKKERIKNSISAYIEFKNILSEKQEKMFKKMKNKGYKQK